ncbi:Lysine-specific demethylase 8 [Trichoplax sp. H2]|nr:Lysine-specific demethylase 8 [Trichoplax sp. H2]|eukprot:RDD43635.1 Lysine-specific demethylase 8 [Trichoplax sp. H2]
MKIILEIQIVTLLTYCLFISTILNGVWAVDYSNHPGHLKPIGFAGPSSDIESCHGFPSLKIFIEEYLNKNKPLLMKDAAKSSPAFKLWSDDYFLAEPESANVNISVEQRKKENRTIMPEDMSFKDFLLRYNNTNEYMVDKVPEPFRKDVYLPSCLQCQVFTLTDDVMWFSSGGTKSVLHTDGYQNLNCLFRGTKDLVMINSSYPREELIEVSKGAYSNVDVDSVDLNKFPKLAEVSYIHVHMEPGDCLYIPVFCIIFCNFELFTYQKMSNSNYKTVAANGVIYRYHHVRSYNRNIAVNTWFLPAEKSYDASLCKDVQQVSQTLNETNFTGLTDPAEDDEYLEFREYLKWLFEDAKKNDLKTLVKSLSMSLPEQSDEEELKQAKRFCIEIFAKVDTDKDGIITTEEINNISDENNSKLSEKLSLFVPLSNSDESEDDDLSQTGDEKDGQADDESSSNRDEL